MDCIFFFFFFGLLDQIYGVGFLNYFLFDCAYLLSTISTLEATIFFLLCYLYPKVNPGF